MEQLINTLSDDLEPVKALRSGDALIVAWWLLAVAAVALVMTLMGPWRSTAIHQLLSAPRFTLEIASGLLASVLLTVYAFRLSVPGAAGRPLLIGGCVMALVWLLTVAGSLLWSPLQPSTLGARHGCYLDTLMLAVPPAILGCWLASQRYLLRPVATSACLGLVAGMIPAVLMQLGCMYGPLHGLLFHILPGLSLVPAIAGTVWLYGAARRRFHTP